jgi:hypothetical protein
VVREAQVSQTHLLDQQLSMAVVAVAERELVQAQLV